MADNPPPQSSNRPAEKTRSPIERLIVWGLIGVLLVAVGFEYSSKSGHEKALKFLQDKIDAVEKDSKNPEVTEADVKAAVGDKKPSQVKEYGPGEVAANGAKRIEVYSWFTLNPASKREMWVYYGAKGKDAKELAIVLEIQASEVMASLPRVAGNAEAGAGGNQPSLDPSEMRRLGGPGGPGGAMMGPPAGQRGRPAAANAADGSENADADKADEKATGDDKSGADKASEEKPAEGNTEKGEDKPEKSDTDQE